MPFSTIYAFLSSFRHTRLLAEFHGHGGPVISLAISPNGKMLASGGRQQILVHQSIELILFDLGIDSVRVWNLETNDAVPIPQQPLHE
jgi:WD40 repeat protein